MENTSHVVTAITGLVTQDDLSVRIEKFRVRSRVELCLLHPLAMEGIGAGPGEVSVEVVVRGARYEF